MNMHSDDPSDKKPPRGLLASLDKVMDEEKAKIATEEHVPAEPSFPNPDPSYQEPTTLDELRVILDNAALDLGSEEYVPRALAVKLLERIEVLQATLIPFASHAMMMSNQRMCLLAAGRDKEPCGGMWLNGVASAQLVPNEHVFFNAVDSVGRKYTEDFIVEMFAKAREAAAGAVEKAEHIADGGKVH